jgi:hypothetical protein
LYLPAYNFTPNVAATFYVKSGSTRGEGIDEASALFARVAPLFIAVAILNGLLTSASSDDQIRALEIDGIERTYDIHIPKNFDNDKPVPLLIALHGRLELLLTPLPLSA